MGRILADNGVVFEEVSLGKSITSSAVRAVSGKSTVPQLFIGGKLIGDSEQIEQHYATAQRKVA